jgi:MFS family permease
VQRPGSTIRTAIVVRNPSFGLLWAGQLLSGVGTWLLLVAVPVHVFRLTGSASATGLTSAAEVLPMLAVGPFAGVFADRWPRRRVMICADMLAAGCVCLLMLVTSRGWVWLALVAIAAENCCAGFFGPACNGVVPAVVGRGRDLERANAWSAVSGGVIRLAGAPLGSVLYAAGGFRLPVGLDAASYLASALLVALMRGPQVTRSSRPAGLRAIAAEQRAGMVALLADRRLRVLLVASALWLLGNGALTALLVPYIVTGLRVPAARVGELFTALGVGYLMSAVAGRRACASPRRRACISGLLTAQAVAYTGLFDWRSLGGALAFAALAGLTGGAFLMLQRTLLQRYAPDHLIGRMTGAFSTVVMAATLAGMLLASLAARHVGAVATRNLAIAVVSAGAAVPILWWPRDANRHPGAVPATGQTAATAAPERAQQRTMSRMDSKPVTSPDSTTIKCRKFPFTIAAAASSSVHSGEANTTSEVR